MIVTIETAKNMLCPFRTGKHIPSMGVVDFWCLADQCMAWHPDWDSPTEKGQCYLVEKKSL